MNEPLTKEDILYAEDYAEETNIGKLLDFKKVLSAKNWLTNKCSNHRTSNELWRLSEDENLDLFESWIDEAFNMDKPLTKKKKKINGTECKHWKTCEFRNDITCDSEMCEEFEIEED